MSISIPAASLAPAILVPAPIPSTPATTPAKPFQPWLNAWTDPVANLHSFSPCLRLADIAADGDHRLLVADNTKKVKVFRGTSLQAEYPLLDAPSAMECYYTDTGKGALPNIAIACGSYVYIYRNMRPYYRYSLPPVTLDQTETAVFDALKAGTMDAATALATLTEAKENGITLSPRVLSLLQLSTVDEQLAQLTAGKDVVYQQLSVVTCMTTIYKSQSNDGSVAQLVIGTESGSVLILNTDNSTIYKQFNLPHVPHTLAVDGQLDIEYRIVVGCREGHVYNIKKGKLLGVMVQQESYISSMCVIDKLLYVACMDNCIHVYNFKGKKSFTLTLGSNIGVLDILHLKKIKNMKVLLVGCTDGQIHIYHKKNCLSTLQHDAGCMALRFGQYGREDACLTLVGSSGSLCIKILQRNANFDLSEANIHFSHPPAEQDIPLKVPKKTKLYVEQTQREREHAIDMHRIFQRELCKMRLSTARAYVRVIQDGIGPLSSVGGINIRLDARVIGLGPLFKLRVGVRNCGSKLLCDLPVVLLVDESKYRVAVCGVRIPCVVPGVEVVYMFDVRSVDAAGAADVVRVFVMNPKSAIPAISAVVNMPVSEVDDI